MVLTASRLVLSPIFVLVFLHDTFGGAIACLAIAIVSELTDLFDGMVARYRNEVTDFGKILDPLADSISRLTIFICFVQGGQAPIYLIVFILYRDSLVATLRTFCAYRGVVVSARKTGKIKAVFQATAILIILLLRIISYRVSPEVQPLILRGEYLLGTGGRGKRRAEEGEGRGGAVELAIRRRESFLVNQDPDAGPTTLAVARKPHLNPAANGVDGTLHQVAERAHVTPPELGEVLGGGGERGDGARSAIDAVEAEPAPSKGFLRSLPDPVTLGGRVERLYGRSGGLDCRSARGASSARKQNHRRAEREP